MEPSDTSSYGLSPGTRRILLIVALLVLTGLVVFLSERHKENARVETGTSLAVYADIDGTWYSLDENEAEDERFTVKLYREFIWVSDGKETEQAQFVRRGGELDFDLDLTDDSGQSVESVGAFTSFHYTDGKSPALYGVEKDGTEVGFARR